MINLIKLFVLTIRRKNSDEDYFLFQKYQASIVVENIINTFKCNNSMTVMDYGCGQGGYSKVLTKYFNKVVAIDYHILPVSHNDSNIEYVVADLLNYKREPVDIVFCASVIEHIDSPKQGKLIKQIADNTRQGGYLYLSFPPFNSPIGGHACAPFHYLPDKLALFLTNTVKRYPIKSYETMYGDWGLYRTNIEEVNRLLVIHGFEILTIKSRYMPNWYSNFFKHNNFLNWNAEFYCRKL